jgi:adenosylhomocysteine nucleosidase
MAKNMKLLVTLAINAEFAPWKSRHPFVPYEFDEAGKRREFDLFRANIKGNQITVLFTGMGAENTRRAMSSVSCENPDVMISTGLAGALDANLKLGEVVVARSTRVFGKKSSIESDYALRELAVAAGARAVDVFLTSETIVATAAEKEELSPSGSVVEMETSYVLEAAAKRQVPAVAVRAISDAADEDLPLDFERVADSRGHIKVSGLLKELTMHPYKLAPLVRFGKQSRASSVALADFLDRFIDLIAEKWSKTRALDREEISAT